MIVLDENLKAPLLTQELTRWYRGAVQPINKLRPATLIKDESIPSLLHKVKQPTFITINTIDFWRKLPAHSDYCILTFPVSQEYAGEISPLVRRLFSVPEFSTKAERMGRIARISEYHIDWYGKDRQIYRIEW